MKPTREELLFGLALTKSAAERAAWLDRECGDDPALRQRPEALLAACNEPDELSAKGAPALVATIKLDLPDAPDEAVDHPNIAKVLDAGTTETGRPYFVM